MIGERYNEPRNKQHSLNSVGYFPDRISEHMPLTGNASVDAKEFYRLVESGNKALKAIRSESKAPTFGLKRASYAVMYR